MYTGRKEEWRPSTLCGRWTKWNARRARRAAPQWVITRSTTLWTLRWPTNAAVAAASRLRNRYFTTSGKPILFTVLAVHPVMLLYVTASRGPSVLSACASIAPPCAKTRLDRIVNCKCLLSTSTHRDHPEGIMKPQPTNLVNSALHPS